MVQLAGVIRGVLQLIHEIACLRTLHSAFAKPLQDFLEHPGPIGQIQAVSAEVVELVP